MDIRSILPSVDYHALFCPTVNNTSTRLTQSLLLLNCVKEPERLLVQETSLANRQSLFPEGATAPPMARPEQPEAEEPDDDYDDFDDFR